MAQKKILHVLQRFRIGGKEEVVKNLMLQKPQKYAPSACVLQKFGFMAKQVVDAGLIVYHIDLSIKNDKFNNLQRLYKIISKNDYKAIFSHDIASWYYSVILSFFLRKTKVIHVRHSFLEKEEKKIILLSFLLSLFSHKIIAVSSAIEKDMIERFRINQNKVTVIYNGIDIDKYSNSVQKKIIREKFDLTEDQFVTGTVSRFFAVKNIESQIDMVERLKDIIPNYIHLIVAPLTDYGERIKKDVEKRGLQKHVRFLGFQKDIPKILTLFNVFVLTSFSEGTPIVLLEAMASKCPIIASAVGGNVKLIEHMKNGILYDVNNTEELCHSVYKLSRDSNLVENLIKQAFVDVDEKFSIKKMLKKYEGLI